MHDWKNCRNILCIRADNMGDVIMTSPAIRALKETYKCRITLLTSKAGSLITSHLPEIDHVLVYDLPWVKATGHNGIDLATLAEKISAENFDAAIIFTVYSQSALPAAMLALMAGIPLRLAYSRENPYQLLTNWVPDREPFDYILHQVERDLKLVKNIGAITSNDSFQITNFAGNEQSADDKLLVNGIEPANPYMILHPGVSEDKRKYPVELWIETGKLLAEKYKMPMLVTGSESECDIATLVADGIGDHAFSIAGELLLGEFIAVVAKAKCIISVNTSTIHIAAATQTPIVVLYAQTNPQHTPWKATYKMLPFSVEKTLKSSNMIVKYVAEKCYSEHLPYPSPEEVVAAAEEFLADNIAAERTIEQAKISH